MKAIDVLILPIVALAAMLSSTVAAQTSAAPSAAIDLRTLDWAATGRYAADNRAVRAVDARPDIVFIGDSITEGWFAPEHGFATPARIGRGISGQTSSQLLVRFRQDVIDLRPRLVHIMVGTNDIASNTGPISDEGIEGNVAAMVELAQRHGIGVILGSIPPADRFPWRPGLETTQHIIALNRWLRDYADRVGAVYADYWSALATRDGAMKDGLSSDHVHPTDAGYRVMAVVAEQAIAAAGKRTARASPLSGASGRAAAPRLPIGIQAWSEHTEIERDPAAGYRALGGYGMRMVELYGLDAPGWAALPKLLATNRLTAISSHVGIDALIADPKEAVRRATVLNLRYLGVPWIKSANAPPGGLTVADADRAAAAFNAACPVFWAAGITPFLHLHGYEFVPDPDGAGTMLDRLLARVPARCMSVELDVFWVCHAGQDPVALLRKLGSRVVLLHLKDPAPDLPVDDSGGVGPGRERALGEGSVDWPALLAQARRQGVRAAFIEDETGEPALNVPRSVAYLRRIGVLR